MIHIGAGEWYEGLSWKNWTTIPTVPALFQRPFARSLPHSRWKKKQRIRFQLGVSIASDMTWKLVKKNATAITPNVPDMGVVCCLNASASWPEAACERLELENQKLEQELQAGQSLFYHCLWCCSKKVVLFWSFLFLDLLVSFWWPKWTGQADLNSVRDALG